MRDEALCTFDGIHNSLIFFLHRDTSTRHGAKERVNRVAIRLLNFLLVFQSGTSVDTHAFSTGPFPLLFRSSVDTTYSAQRTGTISTK